MAAVPSSTAVDPKLLARRRLAALRRRAQRIRVWVGCVAVVLFIAMFSVIYVQLASGHDPVLGSVAKAKTASAPTVTSSAAVSTPAPVTTQQS